MLRPIPQPERKTAARAAQARLAVYVLAALGLAAGAGCGAPGDAQDVGGAPGCYRCDTPGAPDIDQPPARDVAGEAGAPPGGCGLPVLEVHIDDAAWRALHDDPQGTDEVTVGVTIGGQRFEGATLELHGGYARTVPKLSYRLRFPEDAGGADPRLDVFGAGAEPLRRLVLHASWIDPTFARNALVYERLRALGGLAPRTAFVALHFNGAFWGLYVVNERIDALWLRKQGFDPDGNLYKAENHNANWADKSDPLAGYDKERGEDRPSDDLGDLLRALSHTRATAADFAREVEPRLSLADHAVWTALHVLALNQDTFTKNYYLYHDPAAPSGTPAGRFRIVSWDADATFGISWDGARIASDDRRWHGTDAFSPRLYGIPEYRAGYLRGLRAWLEDGPLALRALQARTAEWREALRTCAAADFERWERGLDWDAEYDYLDASIRERHDTLSAVAAERLEGR